jgi:hypothetical protein
LFWALLQVAVFLNGIAQAVKAVLFGREAA